MITRIRLQNFKAFKDAEINLTNLNLFTGMNGMGKSSFIQSLLLLRQSNENLSNNEEGLQLKGELIDIGKGRDAFHIHSDKNFIGFELDFHYEPMINFSFDFVTESDLLIPTKGSDTFSQSISSHMSIFNAHFKYLKAERVAPEHIYKANLSAVMLNKFLGFKGENTPLYIALNKREKIGESNVKNENAINDELLPNIDAWLNEITPGTHINSTYFGDLDVVKIGYQFELIEDYTREFSPVNVGFGFTYILPVITSILTAKQGDLVIIENPESHLHPKGQSKLGELIAKSAAAGVQLIIETHSDHLMNGVRVAVKKQLIKSDDVSLFYFERDAKSTEHSTRINQPFLDENGRLSHQPDGFFDEYSKQLDDLIK